MTMNGKLHVPAALYLGKYPPVPTEYDARWASEVVRMLWKRKKNFLAPGI
jgi:hypothetical protein